MRHSKMILGYSLVFGCFLFGLSQAVLVQDLGGSDWTAISSNKSIKVSSHVPGSIYSDLERAKVIGPLYQDFNDVMTRWISFDTWTFERHFDLSPGVLTKAHIYLTAHGLDTVGTVTLNGHELGHVDNMFIRYRFPISKDQLKEKDNQISIKFESAPAVANKLYEKVTKEHYPIPPGGLSGEQHGEKYVQMLRKMQASFSWDWGPAYPTAGIWRPLTIEAFDSQVLRSVSVETQTSDHKEWTLNYNAIFEGAPSGGEVSGHLSVHLDGTLLDEQKITGIKLDQNGEAHSPHLVKVPEKLAVKPWFPNGAGEQHLYNLSIVFTSDHQETSQQNLRIGFRTIKLIQDKLPSKEEAYSFYFTVNDMPIFAKGSNWIPAHVLNEALTGHYIRELLHSAKRANMNMLRVWGGGIYESDLFYEIADEYGILIWQDMMFACATYPADEKFLTSVKTEIRQQIRRLQHHPSIAIWAGNNENEQALADGWFSETRDMAHHEDYKRDYRTLYVDTIGPIVASEDHSRQYVPSSPSNGIKGKSEQYLSNHPGDTRYGDVHWYIFGGDVWDWRHNPSAKFVSEYGYQSWSSVQTMAKSISAEHLKFPLDDAMRHRQHKGGGTDAMSEMLSHNLALPSGTGLSKLVDYIYITQVWQAMAIKIESEYYRRNRFVNDNGQGNTMGALYWQLNDIWSTVSWASLEFGGKWKMLHYFAEDFFQNLLVDAYLDDKDLKVDIIRDDHQGQQKYTLHIDVFDWSQWKPIHQHQVEVQTGPFNVTHAYHGNLDQFLKEAKCPAKSHCFIEVRLTAQDGQEKSRNFVFVEQPRDAVGMQKTTIKHQVSGPKQDATGAETFTIELESDHIAPFVWLDFASDSDIVGHFSDNGFMMTSPKVTLTFWTTSKPSLDKLKSALVVKSLKDIQ